MDVIVLDIMGIRPGVIFLDIQTAKRRTLGPDLSSGRGTGMTSARYDLT